MIDPPAPLPAPEDESPWLEEITEEQTSAPPPAASVIPPSVRPVTRSLGPRPRAAPGPKEESSSWAVAGFLLGGLTLLVIVFGGGYWGLRTLYNSQEASRERKLVQKTEFSFTSIAYAESLRILNELKPLETDEQHAQALMAGYAAGELGTDEVTANQLKSLLTRVAVATDDDPLAGHLSRPHLFRRILPLVPSRFRSHFALMPSLIMNLGFTDPHVTLVRVSPWDTGDPQYDGRMVYTHIRSGPSGDAMAIRFWVVRDQGVWKCVDYEYPYYGLSAGEMATLNTCCLICENHPLSVINTRRVEWGNSSILQQPEAELAWITAQVDQLPLAIRDSILIASLDRLSERGLSDELYSSAIANLPKSTRSTMRGEFASRLHLTAGRAEQSLQECDTFRSRFGDTSPSILKDRVHALLALGRFDEALHDLESLLPRFPTETSLFTSLALASRPDDVQPLVKAVMQHPRPGEAVSLAYYALTASRGTESLSQFIEALARDPRFRTDVARLRTWKAGSEANPAGAVAVMRLAIELAPKDRRDEICRETFELMLSHGQGEAACGLYSDDEKLAAALLEIFHAEDYWPYEKDGVRPLLAPLKRLAAARPQDHEIWYLLGTAHSTLKEWGEAVTAFAHSLQVQPVDPLNAGAETSENPERAKLAYFSWLSALQLAGQWTDLEQALAKDPLAVEHVVGMLAGASEPGFITWAKRYLAEHPESPHALALQTALAQQAEDWASVRNLLTSLIDLEKEETKLDGLRRQLAYACVNDPDLQQSWKQIVTAKNLDFACQALQQRGDTWTLLRLIAILKSERPPRGIRNRLPYWEAQAWAEMGRYREFDTPAIQEVFVNPAAEDLESIRALAHRWDGHSLDSERKGIANEVLTAEDPQYKRIQLAIAVRLGNIDQLLGLLSEEQERDRFQSLYSQPAYQSLWTEAYRPVRELAPRRITPQYFSSRRILLELGPAPDPPQWESRLNGLRDLLGKDVEVAPLAIAEGSPARQIHCVRSGDQECLVAIGDESAADFPLNESYSFLSAEHRDLLRTHGWWIQVTPAPSTAYGESLWSETVAAALVQEQTIAVYHDALRCADIGKGPMEFRRSALEVHRFAHSDQPWSELDVSMLRRSNDHTGAFWWNGPQLKQRGSDSSGIPPRSLYELFRSCPPDQVVRATVKNFGGWYSDPIVVDVERLVIQQGTLQSVRCRVVTPSQLYPQLVTGEPLLLALYQLHEPNTVLRSTK